MALSRLAREFAAEISNHDWSDAPYRRDRAGHRREFDSSSAQTPQMTEREALFIQTNVVWVVAQVLGHEDPNFDIDEFARECDVRDLSKGFHYNGVRRNADGSYATPGAMPA